MRDISFGHWLDGLASRSPTPAGGALAYATLAGCAALGSKLARLSHSDHEVFMRWSSLFADHASADADCYSPGDPDTFAGELHRAENALDFVRLLDGYTLAVPDRARPDLEAVRALANTSVGVIVANLKANLALVKGEREGFSVRVEAILRRAS